MADSNNKQSRGLISNAFGVAKKLSSTGFDLINHVAPGTISKINEPIHNSQVLTGTASKKTMSERSKYENPQQMMREHVPKLTQQFLGRHYNKVNQVASFISPNLNDKISDFFFDKLNDFASDISSVDHVLKEVGAKELTELAKDSSRSLRISQALANQNKLLATVQGALTGASGIIGTAIDIPTSLALTLRVIYQTGRAHGFELDRAKEQQVVEYVFKQVDLGSIAEKQTLLVALRTLSNLIETQDTQQLQKLLGSTNDGEMLKKWLSNEDGSFNWAWLSYIPNISILSKLTPVAGAGIGAVYSRKLLEDAKQKSQLVFSQAQQYLLQHPDQKLDVVAAYEKSVALLAQAAPLLNPADADVKTVQPVTPAAPVENKVITQVQVKRKGNDEPKVEAVSVESGLQKLVEEYVEPVDEVTSQVSLADKGGEELIQALDEDDQEYAVDSDDSLSKGEATVVSDADKAPKAKKKTSEQSKTDASPKK